MTRTRRDLDFLPRVLSKWGRCSRREAERWVTTGRVSVNGVVRRSVVEQVRPDHDRIEVDGEPLRRAAWVYAKLHKPVGVVTTMKDPDGRPTIAGMIPPALAGAMPVGRLDLDSSGLLLLTNDHSLAARVAGPDHRVKKVYRVEVNQHPDEERLAPIRAGIELDGRVRCRPVLITILERRERSTLLELTLDEGKFRQIRRSLKAVGLRVRTLHRVKVGPIELGDLEPGAIAALTDAEIAALRAAADGEERTRGAGARRAQ